VGTHLLNFLAQQESRTGKRSVSHKDIKVYSVVVVMQCVFFFSRGW
jgi:hypothetical protein